MLVLGERYTGSVEVKSSILSVSTRKDDSSESSFSFIGAFMRGNKPLVLPGVKEGLSKAKTGELNASPAHLKISKPSKYNSKGLATALLKYEEELTNENK